MSEGRTVHDQRVEVGGVSGVVRRVRGEGPALVLVPGCGRDQHAFDALLGCLPFGGMVVCLPGRAGIPGPAPVTAGEAAEWVRSVLDALGVERAVVGGHSYGGGVAIELALGSPERVEALVLLDTGARLRAHPDILAGAEAAAAVEPAAAANLADWRACHAFDRMLDVGRISAPALVLTGADDVLTPPRYARYLAERLPRATLVLVEGAGHDAPTTHPERVAAEITSFLRQTFASRP